MTVPADRARVLRRVADFFAVDDVWERPAPAVSRRDVAVTAGILVLALLTLEMSRSLGGLDHTPGPVWVQRLAVVAGAALLLPRRRLPLTVATLAAAHMFVVGVTMPAVMGQVSLQVVYFVAFFSGVAWARDRRAMTVVVGAIVTIMLVWVAWQFALGNAVEQLLAHAGTRRSTGDGWLDPVVAGVGLTFLVNVVYFGGAVVGGQVAWRGARQRSRLEDQARTIAGQTEHLRRTAVVEERLRIARELHDVVAHHVSVIGVQAAAGRRVLDRDPEAARRALEQVELSSREAVTQMRDLLGTLRGGGGEEPEERGRTPEPGIAEVAPLVEQARGGARAVGYDLVESPEGAARLVPGPIALSVYRTVQEALTNVERHSTARRVGVVVRVQAREGSSPGEFVEVEVLDDGRPRRGTSGSGLGQLGIRERAASHRGEVEIGPRAVGGYRVRVRYPLRPGGGAPRAARALDDVRPAGASR